MNAQLTINIASTDPVAIQAALRILEDIKKDHPNLFQQAEMVVSI